MKKNRLPKKLTDQVNNKRISSRIYTIMKAKFEQTSDFKELTLEKEGQTLVFSFLQTLVSKENFEEYVLLPLLKMDRNLNEETLKSLNGELTSNPEDLTKGILEGGYALYISGRQEAWLFKWPKAQLRNVQEPTNEGVVRGAHDGFVENLQANISQLRMRIKSSDLIVKYFDLGVQTQTKTAVIYINGLADEKIVEEVDRRLSSITADMVIAPGYIEEFIEDNPFSIFPQMINTERPDRAAANLLEGRIMIIGDGSPSALIIPATFFAFYQSADDYNSRWIPATFIRLLRYVSFIIAITLPSMYIAIIAFHLEVIPHELLLPLKASVQGIPYPPLLEAILMEVTIELIREAGIRLPRPIGQTIGIVGGLVIGEAVVNAGMISNIMIVIVAVTAISAYVVPSNEMSTSVRLLRFPLMVMAAFLGFVGVVFGLVVILIKLCKLETFGVPYFSPLAPFHMKDIKDTFIRMPLWMMNDRPKNAHPLDKKRQRDSRGWKMNEQK